MFFIYRLRIRKEISVVATLATISAASIQHITLIKVFVFLFIFYILSSNIICIY